MKGLTICQPFASLIASGEKRIENRIWESRYRGTLYIHAGKSLEWLSLDRGEKPPAGMVFGAIVAISKLVDCLHIDEIKHGLHDVKYPWLREHEHTSGPWCWILDAVAPIGPWPWKGAQGLWNVDEVELGIAANKALGIPEPPVPTFECVESRAPDGTPLWKFRCPHCKRHHTHGAQPGHRCAHCFKPNSPYKERGYILKLRVAT